MIYRKDEMIDLANKAREAAKIKNNTKLEAEKSAAAKLVPRLLEEIFVKIEDTSSLGGFWLNYKPPFWNPKYWFSWNTVLRNLIIDELERRKFHAKEICFPHPIIRISWGD